MATNGGQPFVSLDRLVDEIEPGSRVFLPGVSGEPAGIWDRLTADLARSRDLDIWSTAVPGINTPPFEKLHPTARVTGLFMRPGLHAMQAEGRYRHLPACFYGFVRHIRERLELDTCVVQLSAPDASGRCSYGPGVTFTPLARTRSRRTLAVINARTPFIPNAPSIPLDEIDLAAEVDAALPSYEVGAPSRSASIIARHAASFVQDGSALQVGLGKVPDALFELVRDRRKLRIHSGMLADGALDLADAGALDPAFEHVTCVWVGTAGLYERLRGRREITVAGVERTHDVSRMAALDRFVALNSALAVDLFGQANLEHAGPKAVSGVGGAADFVAGARYSPGGMSIIALPASFERDTRSRIVPRLGDGVASLSRCEVDVVITEHGVANLRGLSVHERAEALIAIASPTFRSDLTDAWAEIRRAL